MKGSIALLTGFALAFTIGTASAEEKKAVDCGDVDAAMMEANGGKSAEEIAAKLHTTVAHVRECWDKQENAQKAVDNPPAAPAGK